jgi:GntR family transcriptional regulator
VTQVVLAIVSGDLRPGQRLPSTRDLARRFHLHPNTVSAGYRSLDRDRWVEFRKGSGIFVRQQKREAPPALALERLISEFLQSARNLGVSLATLQSRLRQWLELQPPDHFLLIEPDEEIARIVCSEITAAVSLPVSSCNVDQCRQKESFAGAVPVATAINARAVREALPESSELLVLQLRSAGDSLATYLPVKSPALIGIASRWPTFLKMARTMLIAAGFDPDALLLRDASKPNWQRGLDQAQAVICDTVTAKNLNGHRRVLPFALLSPSSLERLRDYESSLRSALAEKM